LELEEEIMSQEEFITAIKTVVHDAAIEDMKETLVQPSGRNPDQKIRELSAWFNNLSESHKMQAMELVRQSVHASIFGILCVLDGVRTIETVKVFSLKLFIN
jgi:hypothetical protein